MRMKETSWSGPGGGGGASACAHALPVASATAIKAMPIFVGTRFRFILSLRSEANSYSELVPFCETSRIACGVPSALTIRSARTVPSLSIAATGNPNDARAARGISTRTTAPSSKADGSSAYGSGWNDDADSESSISMIFGDGDATAPFA